MAALDPWTQTPTNTQTSSSRWNRSRLASFTGKCFTGTLPNRSLKTGFESSRRVSGQWRVVLTRQDKFETQVHQSPCELDNRKEDDEAKVCDAKQTLICCAVCPGCTQTKCQCLCPDLEPKIQNMSTGRGRQGSQNERKSIQEDVLTKARET